MSNERAIGPAEEQAFLLNLFRGLRKRDNWRSATDDDLRDLTSDAWIGWFRSSQREEVRNTEAYMTRIAKCRWEDFKDRVGARLEVPDGNGPEPIAHVESHPTRDDRLRFIVLEYFKVRKSSCADLARAFFARLDWKTVAKAMNLAQNTVTKRWSRCLQTLREDAARDPLLHEQLSQWL